MQNVARQIIVSNPNMLEFESRFFKVFSSYLRGGNGVIHMCLLRWQMHDNLDVTLLRVFLFGGGGSTTL